MLRRTAPAVTGNNEYLKLFWMALQKRNTVRREGVKVRCLPPLAIGHFIGTSSVCVESEPQRSQNTHNSLYAWQGHSFYAWWISFAQTCKSFSSVVWLPTLHVIKFGSLTPASQKELDFFFVLDRDLTGDNRPVHCSGKFYSPTLARSLQKLGYPQFPPLDWLYADMIDSFLEFHACYLWMRWLVGIIFFTDVQT